MASSEVSRVCVAFMYSILEGTCPRFDVDPTYLSPSIIIVLWILGLLQVESSRLIVDLDCFISQPRAVCHFLDMSNLSGYLFEAPQSRTLVRYKRQHILFFQMKR